MDYPGGLIITGVKGLTLNEEEKHFVKQEKLGGVILFANNFSDPAQFAELINSIQALRDEWPLFIAVDHEGGRVMHFKKGFTQYPSMYEISRLDSPKLTYEVHAVMAKELAACGVNLSFSPVCDIWTNPENKVIGDRSFGHNPDEVEKHVSAAIRGLQTNGILACAKHFPGHGNTLKDSHYDLPLIKESLDELRAREVIPFVKAAKSRAEFMMMAHLQVDALDEELPTSLSERAYNFLREETKFTKVVVTDEMEMKAVSEGRSVEDAAVQAICAGADMLIYRNAASAERAVEALRDAIKSKKLKKEHFLDKLERIERCKSENLREYRPVYVPKISNSFNSPESKQSLELFQSLKLKKETRSK